MRAFSVVNCRLIVELRLLRWDCRRARRVQECRGTACRARGRRAARGGVLEQYVEHGEQAQRSNGGPIVCFGRQVVRKAG